MIGQAIALISHEGKVLQANSAFREIFSQGALPVWDSPAPSGEITLGDGSSAQWSVEPFGDHKLLVITTEDPQLTNAKAELESFLYVVSHDLRGPLRAILSAGMILIEDFGDSLPPEGQAELKRQSQAAKKLNLMLEEILKLSRLGRLAFEPEPIRVSAIAESVAAHFRENGAQIVIQPNLQATGSHEMVERLFFVLFDNAVKFAKPSSPAQISVCQEPAGAFVVEDRGIGFPNEYGEKAFTVFDRFHGDTYAGMGTGLTVAKRIVERHSGKIEICGVPNEGATVRFTLG